LYGELSFGSIALGHDGSHHVEIDESDAESSERPVFKKALRQNFWSNEELRQFGRGQSLDKAIVTL
jgi:hypothetical protein